MRRLENSRFIVLGARENRELLLVGGRRKMWLSFNRSDRRLNFWVEGVIRQDKDNSVFLDGLVVTRVNSHRKVLRWFKHQNGRLAISADEAKRVFMRLGFRTGVVDAFFNNSTGVRAFCTGRQRLGEYIVGTRYLYSGVILNQTELPPGARYTGTPRVPEAVIFSFDRAGNPHILDGVKVNQWWRDSTNGGSAYARMSWRKSGAGCYWWAGKHCFDSWDASKDAMQDATNLFSSLGFDSRMVSSVLKKGREDTMRLIRELKKR
jgi:hypothetical protein